MQKIKVGILGATGLVGRAYLKHLSFHPYFEVTFLAGSEKSANKTYTSALANKGIPLWPFLESFGTFNVFNGSDFHAAKERCDLIFSAVDSNTAKELEPLYAASGFPVLSNASSYRMDSDIPILIPEINPQHLDVLKEQQKNRGWDSGFIVTKSNCSLMSFLIPLFPLHQKFKIKKLVITTLQALSGAGDAGPTSLDTQNNILPYIPEEEEKSSRESLKILGKVQSGEIHSLDSIPISVTCNRVPISDGHTACVDVEFETKPNKEEILQIWEEYRGVPQELNLPSAPKQPICYLKQENRPQPKWDLKREKGMAISVGRLRESPALHYSFTALSHNVLRGAALGGILNAELLFKLGMIKSKSANPITELLESLY